MTAAAVIKGGNVTAIVGERVTEDKISFLVGRGMPPEEIKRLLDGGMPLDEIAYSSERIIARGESISVPSDIAEEQEKKSGKSYLHMDTLEQILADRGMSARFNVLTHDVELSGLPSWINTETSHNDTPALLFDELKEQYRCDRQTVSDLLSLVAGRQRYNPVLDMITAERWDREDRIAELYAIMGLQGDDLSQVLLYKWLIQAFALLTNDPKHPFGADGILVLQGAQGIGKTSFVRKIGLSLDFVKLGQYIDPHDKDTTRCCCSAWISELGEIETTLKSDMERLKAFITAEVDEYRLPYGRADQRFARRTSLIGTCNGNRFLIDPTGSRRFWTVPVETIGLDRLNTFDALQLWREIKQHYEAGTDFRLTRDERQELESRNAAYQKPQKAQEEVEDILANAESDPAAYNWEFMTVTAFKETYDSLSRYTVQQIAAALNAVGIKAQRKK